MYTHSMTFLYQIIAVKKGFHMWCIGIHRVLNAVYALFLYIQVINIVYMSSINYEYIIPLALLKGFVLWNHCTVYWSSRDLWYLQEKSNCILQALKLMPNFKRVNVMQYFISKSIICKFWFDLVKLCLQVCCCNGTWD